MLIVVTFLLVLGILWLWKKSFPCQDLSLAFYIAWKVLQVPYSHFFCLTSGKQTFYCFSIVVRFPEVAHLASHTSLSRLASFLIPLMFSPGLQGHSLPFNSKQYSIVWPCCRLFTCSRTDRCFDYWQVRVITGKAVINMLVQVFMWMLFRPSE